MCFRRENDKPINEKEIIDRWDVCIASMRKMTEIFMRMRENLGKIYVLKLDRFFLYFFKDPFEFYHGMRPYLAGSYNNPGLPNGLIFKGISTEGKRYIGGSAAQRKGSSKNGRYLNSHNVQNFWTWVESPKAV